MRKSHLALAIVLALLAPALVGCDHPPQVTGTLTVHVANEVPEQIPTALFEAGLALISQQLAQQGLHVELVPAIQARGQVDVPDVVLEPAGLVHLEGDQALHVPIPPDFQAGDSGWQDLVRDQVLRSLGRD